MRTQAAQVANQLVPALQHQRQQRPRHQVQATHIDRPRLPPLIGVAVDDGDEGPEVPGVVDENVEAAVHVSGDGVRGGLEGGAVGDVHGIGEEFGGGVAR